MTDFFRQYSAAQTGTIAIQNSKQDVLLIHNNASLSASLTITFPAAPRDTQRFTIVTAFGITALTISSAIPRVGALTSLPAGGFATWVYSGQANKWFRCG